MEQRLKLGCVVMAAGNAKRFGANKLASQLRGRSLILRSLEAVPQEAFERVVVVTQYPEIMRLVKEFHFSSILNDQPDEGLSRTIHLGLTALRDCDGVLFQVADQPLLRRESVLALTEQWRLRPTGIAALGQSLRLSLRPVPGADGAHRGPGRQHRHPPPRGPADAAGGPGGGALRCGHRGGAAGAGAGVSTDFCIKRPGSDRSRPRFIICGRRASPPEAGCCGGPRQSGSRRPQWPVPWGWR